MRLWSISLPSSSNPPSCKALHKSSSVNHKRYIFAQILLMLELFARSGCSISGGGAGEDTDSDALRSIEVQVAAPTDGGALVPGFSLVPRRRSGFS